MSFVADANAPSTSAAPVAPAQTQHGSNTAVNGDGMPQITLTDPQKHGEGMQAHTTYAINVINSQKPPVRRRYGEFSSLQQMLAKEYPHCVLPPLPSKKRLAYLDRFSDEFVEKRRVALERFLNRLSEHTLLGPSVAVQRFLKDDTWSPGDAPEMEEKESVMEQLSDSLMNAFAKVKQPNPRFEAIREQIGIYEDNLNSVEKNLLKLAKCYQELSHLQSGMAEEWSTLVTMEVACADPLAAISLAKRGTSTAFQQLASTEQKDAIGRIHDQLGFCDSVRAVLKTCDQKQIDHETLDDYLQQAMVDRDRLQDKNRSHSSLKSFIRDKVDTLKGADLERVRQERLGKTEQKIVELQSAGKNSKQDAEAFSVAVAKEIERYEQTRTAELKTVCRMIVQDHVQCYEAGYQAYSKLIERLEKLQ